MTDQRRIDFYLDPLCPWCWLTSRWMDSLRTRKNLEIVPHLYSLIQGAGEAPALSEEREWPLRMVAHILDEKGPKAAWDLYGALGRRHHGEGRAYSADLLEEAALSIGMPSGWAQQACTDPQTYASLRDAHQAARALGVFGVPTISVDKGAPVFGPVIDTVLDGNEAESLFGDLTRFANAPYLSEMKKLDRRAPEVSRTAETQSVPTPSR